MMVLHCGVKGRGKCGRLARRWVRWTYKGIGDGTCITKAHGICQKCLDNPAHDYEDLGAVDQPMLQKVSA